MKETKLHNNFKRSVYIFLLQLISAKRSSTFSDEGDMCPNDEPSISAEKVPSTLAEFAEIDMPGDSEERSVQGANEGELLATEQVGSLLYSIQ